MKLTIKNISTPNDYQFSKDVFYLNGEKIGSGQYGGEPEDNSRNRDYNWVPHIIKLIAEKLGADVEMDVKEVSDEEYNSL